MCSFIQCMFSYRVPKVDQSVAIHSVTIRWGQRKVSQKYLVQKCECSWSSNIYSFTVIFELKTPQTIFLLYVKSSFAKTNKRHPKTELFTPHCSLYYIVFIVKIFFVKNRQSPACLPANTYAISQKLINTTFAGWPI